MNMERREDSVVVIAKDIVIIADDANGISRRFFVTSDIVHCSNALRDMATDFSRDGVLATMETTYAGTLTNDVVATLDAIVPLLVRISGATRSTDTGPAHAAILASMGVRVSGRNSVSEKMAILMLFGFFNYYDMHVPLKLLAETFAQYALYNNESWFDLRVPNKPVGTGRLLEAPIPCVACNVTMAVGTCQQCATPLQVCSATCLDKVHAVCAPFSFIVPSDHELSVMQNILFPAKFDAAALTAGFNMDERQAIIRVYSMDIWMGSAWNRNDIPYAVHRIRWAYVTRRLPNRMPLAHEPHPRENEAREVALSLALFNAQLGSDYTLRQPGIGMTDGTLCDLIMHLNRKATPENKATLEFFCIRFQYMEGLRYLWGGSRPSTLNQCLHVLSCVSQYGGSDGAVRLAMASPLLTEEIIRARRVHSYLVEAIKNSRVSVVRIMLDDGRVDLREAHITVSASDFATTTDNAKIKAMVLEAYAKRPVEEDDE